MRSRKLLFVYVACCSAMGSACSGTSNDEFAATATIAGELGLRMYLGPSYRAGVNVGYMKFRHKGKWWPF